MNANFNKDEKIVELQDLIVRLTPPKRDMEYAYEMGRDCGINGANETNCHFAIFSSPENTTAWERGKRDAGKGNKKRDGK